MELFAVVIPVLMLGVVLALGRYEEMLLPAEEPAEKGAARPAPPLAPRATSPSSPAPAGTPAPSP